MHASLRQPADESVGAKFYCPHALAHGNQCIWIRQKTLEFCYTVSVAYLMNDIQIHSFTPSLGQFSGLSASSASNVSHGISLAEAAELWRH